MGDDCGCLDGIDITAPWLREVKPSRPFETESWVESR